jgi:hypothetical protein
LLPSSATPWRVVGLLLTLLLLLLLVRADLVLLLLLLEGLSEVTIHDPVSEVPVVDVEDEAVLDALS